MADHNFKHLKEVFKTNPSLPVVVPYQGFNIYINNYRSEVDFEEVASLLIGASKEGIGIDPKTYVTGEDVRKQLDGTATIVCRHSSENGEVISVCAQVPSELSRSERGPFTGGQMVINSKYRRLGLAPWVLAIGGHFYPRPGIMRHTITAKSHLAGRSSGGIFCGIIPKSVKINNPNVVADDLIIFYAEHFQKSEMIYQEQIFDLPELIWHSEFDTLNSRLPLICSNRQIEFMDGRNANIKEVPTAEYPKVEGLIRDAALSGTTIGIDEFKETGVWNRKFLRKTYVIGTYCDQTELAGVAMFGPSSVCRTNSYIIDGYVLVDPKHQNRGLEAQLVNSIIEISRKLNFEGILFDVYRSDWKFVDILMNMGFIITGCLPKCGYLKGRGLTDSILLYKEFVIGCSKL